MRQSVKDELVDALTELSEDYYRSFSVAPTDRNCNMSDKHICKWEVRVMPDHGFITCVKDIVLMAMDIDSTVVVTFTQDKKSYLTLV